MSMGQLLPAIDPSKSHIDRKNSEVFRNFVLDKIYAIEENKAKQQSKSEKKDEMILDSSNISKRKPSEPFTISGTRLKEVNNFAEGQSGTRTRTDQLRRGIKTKYDYLNRLKLVTKTLLF